jgi:hypothetical protein
MQIPQAVYQLVLRRSNVWQRPLLLTTVRGKLIPKSLSPYKSSLVMKMVQFLFLFWPLVCDQLVCILELLKVSENVGITAGWERSSLLWISFLK